jgi:hypothetical protein
LLTYLAERAIRGEVPKEFDISVDVFGKASATDESPDAQTRVHIYKLRARLDSYYAGAGRTDSLRLEIPKGTYHLVAVGNNAGVAGAQAVAAPVAFHRRAATRYAASALLIGSLLVNVVTFSGYLRRDEEPVLEDSVWAGLGAGARPILIVVGDHFFFSADGSRVRTRDVAINSQEDLRASEEYGPSTGLVFETLSYLPKSTAFALQTILPRATSSGRDVHMKLVSELTPEDLRDNDVIYVGFVRAMALLRDFYFTRSNFNAEPPLFMGLADLATGEVFTRSGPGPQHNRDYGALARFVGPAGNQILIFAGIGDVGVSAVVRSSSSRESLEHIEALLREQRLDASKGFEILIEADGHSRTDLGFRVLGAYALKNATAPAPTTPAPAERYSDGPRDLSAAEK